MTVGLRQTATVMSKWLGACVKRRNADRPSCQNCTMLWNKNRSAYQSSCQNCVGFLRKTSRFRHVAAAQGGRRQPRHVKTDEAQTANRHVTIAQGFLGKTTAQTDRHVRIAKRKCTKTMASMMHAQTGNRHVKIAHRRPQTVMSKLHGASLRKTIRNCRLRPSCQSCTGLP